jgi:hypothetical protein
MVVAQHRPAHFGRGILFEVRTMKLDWEKYRSDFRRFTDGFVRALSKFTKVERIDFRESVSSNYQNVTVFYINKTQKIERVEFFTFADRLPQTIDLALSRLFIAAGLDWWCYQKEHSGRVTVYNGDAMRANMKINILSIPWDWAEVDRPVEVEVWRDRKLIYSDKISIFDIFDFVVAAFTLSEI